MYSWFVLGRFCRSCIATSLKNNKWTCPYCRAYLPSEGVPATDVAKRMKSEYQKCTECDTPVRDPACAQVTSLDRGENCYATNCFAYAFDLILTRLPKVYYLRLCPISYVQAVENGHLTLTIT